MSFASLPKWIMAQLPVDAIPGFTTLVPSTSMYATLLMDMGTTDKVEGFHVALDTGAADMFPVNYIKTYHRAVHGLTGHYEQSVPFSA